LNKILKIKSGLMNCLISLGRAEELLKGDLKKLLLTNTIVEYIQRVKIEAAKKQLETGRKTVNEVMYCVGYTDTKAFRDVFKKIIGMFPVGYRNKYNQ